MKLAPTLATLALIAHATAAHAQRAPEGAAPVSTQAPAEAPEVHHPPPIVRLKLIGVGLLITGGAWAASFASAESWPEVAQPKAPARAVPTGPPGSNDLKIPLAGPWIALGKSGCAADTPNCGAGTIAVRAALYMLDGIAQIAGLALITEAIVMKTEQPADKKKTSALLGLSLHGVEVQAVPLTTPSMTGLGLVGTF